MLLKPNAVNQFMKDTIIFQEQQTVTHVCIIVKGHLSAKNLGSQIVFSSGNMIGIPDLFLGKYLCDYVAQDEVVLYPFETSTPADLKNIFATNQEYQGIMIYSLCAYIKKMRETVDELENYGNGLYSFIRDSYDKYENYCAQNQVTAQSLQGINQLAPYENDFKSDPELLQYYQDCSKIPLTVIKEYFKFSEGMTMHHIEEAAGLVAGLTMESMELAQYIVELFELLMDSNGAGLFCNVAELFLTIKDKGHLAKESMEMIDLMVDEINRTEVFMEHNTGCRLSIDRSQFEGMYCNLVRGNELLQEQEKQRVSPSQIVKNVKDSLRQILHFSGIELEKKQQMVRLMGDFVNLEDRLVVTEEVRGCRKELTKLYYELYEKVFFQACEKKIIPEVVRLFLNYGFVDERLLTQEQIFSLYQLEVEKKEGPVKVYTFYEWLKLIYEGKEEPSKNEFDLEYADYIRDMRKSGRITEEEVKQRLEDRRARVQYEIQNAFVCNNRVLQGQLSTFVPFLHQEVFLNFPEKEFLTEERIHQAFADVHAIDYSAFYREVMYMNQAAGIEKEMIMKEVKPNIILLPIAGSNGSMWQEISGRRRTNPGRFILPIFLDTNLNDLMIRLFGRFRWELCRCIQGTAWNNLKQKSLTSEYMDYLQFYRKNQDLTEDRKERIKSQIQKVRNNSREVFVMDYEAWIKGEAGGAIRLNKVVREIMATYCPFAKPIREKVLNQPLFADAFARFHRNTIKKNHELELRLHALKREDATITQEIMNTVVFYKDL